MESSHKYVVELDGEMIWDARNDDDICDEREKREKKGEKKKGTQITIWKGGKRGERERERKLYLYSAIPTYLRTSACKYNTHA